MSDTNKLLCRVSYVVEIDLSEIFDSKNISAFREVWDMACDKDGILDVTDSVFKGPGYVPDEVEMKIKYALETELCPKLCDGCEEIVCEGDERECEGCHEDICVGCEETCNENHGTLCSCCANNEQCPDCEDSD